MVSWFIYFCVEKNRGILLRHEESHKCKGCKSVFADRADLEACEAGHVFLYKSKEQVLVYIVPLLFYRHHVKQVLTRQINFFYLDIQK